jgi:phosphatidylglycerophosphate synthase
VKPVSLISISNGLSLARAPLALLFLQSNVFFRVLAIFLAMITDSIDGYVARKSGSTSRFGAILDPTMDKFFVYFSLAVLFVEGNIGLWAALTMLSRDFFLCVFGVYLLVTKKLFGYECHAIRWGKITTALQFLVLLGLTLHIVFPWYLYFLFVLFGVMAFLELLYPFRKKVL